VKVGNLSTFLLMQTFTKLSIITICFNNLEEVRATCASVDKQIIPPFEHLIINGSTNDEIRKYLEQTNQVLYRKVINESDEGIADAFNKGIVRSSGDVILLLNSGDLLYDDKVVEIVLSKFDQDKSLMWLHGKYRYQRSGVWVTLGKPFDPKKIYRGMRSLSHQTMYVRRELYDKYGLYDNSFKIAMDFDFVARIRFEKFLFLDEILAINVPGGISIERYNLALKEAGLVVQKYLGFSWKNKLWTLRLKTLKAIQDIPIIGKILYKIKVALGLENA
jgi:glycosyltransferase involved in cell wall biosynthesis